MKKTVWQQRIRRAEHLAARHSFSAEILGFYVHVARFQEHLSQKIQSMQSNDAETLSHDAGAPYGGGLSLHPALASSFPEFLAVVVDFGPAALVQVAGDLKSSATRAHDDLLAQVWAQASESPSLPEEFLALAFLQPYAELARTRSRLRVEGYMHPLCPFCNRKPAFAVLRPLGDGAQRRLTCGFCLAEWDFRRVICPGCGEEQHAKLPVYTAETFPHIRVEACDTCRKYVKSIDLSKDGLAEPLVDELAAIPLDLWAQEHGYCKLTPNLLGM